jgi:hypothetical protein
MRRRWASSCQRGNDGRLLASEDHRRQSPQRDLGLTEADIPDDEPVHGVARCKVGKHLIGGAGLIGC